MNFSTPIHAISVEMAELSAFDKFVQFPDTASSCVRLFTQIEPRCRRAFATRVYGRAVTIDISVRRMQDRRHKGKDPDEATVRRRVDRPRGCISLLTLPRALRSSPPAVRTTRRNVRSRSRLSRRTVFGFEEAQGLSVCRVDHEIRPARLLLPEEK